jgi:hypothetical protein
MYPSRVALHVCIDDYQTIRTILQSCYNSEIYYNYRDHHVLQLVIQDLQWSDSILTDVLTNIANTPPQA